MKNQDILKAGTVLVIEGNEEVVVAGYAKGWYTAEDGMKFRAKQIMKVVGEAMTGPKNMSKTLSKYAEGYEPSIAASGRKSLNTGDEIAHLLAGLEPLAVMRAAESILGLESDELVTKYQFLNHGQQRMNAGNRIRSALKRGDITPEIVKVGLAIH